MQKTHSGSAISVGLADINLTCCRSQERKFKEFYQQQQQPYKNRFPVLMWQNHTSSTIVRVERFTTGIQEVSGPYSGAKILVRFVPSHYWSCIWLFFLCVHITCSWKINGSYIMPWKSSFMVMLLLSLQSQFSNRNKKKLFQKISAIAYVIKMNDSNITGYIQ